MPQEEEVISLPGVIRWQTRLITTNAVTAAQKVRGGTFTFASSGAVTSSKATPGLKTGFLVCDPDGHVMRLAEQESLQEGAAQ